MIKLNTLFLDRDGVINVKLAGKYVQHKNECVFMPVAITAIAKLNKVFDRILIVTNQQGIGKGIMTEKELADLHEFMLYEISKQGGVIEKVYYCPHLATLKCACRKPESGMLIQAKQDFPEIDFENSTLVGDSDSDIIAGKSVGISTVKVDDEYTLSAWSEEIISIVNNGK